MSLPDVDIPDMDMRLYHFLSLGSFLSGGRAVDSCATPFVGLLKPNWRSTRWPTPLDVAVGVMIGGANGNGLIPGTEAEIDPGLVANSSSSSSVTPSTVLVLFRIAEAAEAIGAMAGACP